MNLLDERDIQEALNGEYGLNEERPSPLIVMVSSLKAAANRVGRVLRIGAAKADRRSAASDGHCLWYRQPGTKDEGLAVTRGEFERAGPRNDVLNVRGRCASRVLNRLQSPQNAPPWQLVRYRGGLWYIRHATGHRPR